MSTLPVSFSFVSSLQALSSNLSQEMEKFPVIPLEKQYKFKASWVTLGAGCAVTSIGVAFFTRFPFPKKACLVGLFTAGSGYSFYSSISTNLVESEQQKDQISRINNLFNPLIEGLDQAYRHKAVKIRDAVRNKPAETLDKAYEQVNTACKEYNENQKDIIEKIKKSAEQLKNFSESSNIDTAALNKLKELVTAVDKFIEGDKEDENFGQNAYIPYKIINDKIFISLKFVPASNDGVSERLTDVNCPKLVL